MLVGKGKAHLDVEGPHEQVILIDGMALVEEIGAIVLRSQQKICFNRYVKSARITAKYVLYTYLGELPNRSFLTGRASLKNTVLQLVLRIKKVKWWF